MHIFEGQHPNSNGGKEAIFHSDCSPIYGVTRYGDAAISNATIDARIRYGNSVHVTDGCWQLRAFKNVVKQLQIMSDMVVFDGL